MILKKARLLVFLLSGMLTAGAQIPKGALMAGGSIGFSYTSDHQNFVNTASFNFSPLFGGFAAKNFAIGVSPVIGYTSSSGTSPDSFHTHIFNSQLAIGIGPFFRYYVKISSKARMFIHAAPSILVSWTQNSDNSNSPVLRSTMAQWQLGPGLSFLVAPDIAIEAAVYYNGTWHRSSYFVNGNLLGNPGTAYTDNGMVLNVGVQVYLLRKHQALPQPAPQPDK